MMDEVQRNKDYKLIDLIKFLCAYLVIGIHTRPLQAVSVLLDKVVYYNISNYAVPFFYACTGYFLIVKQPEKDLHTKLGYSIKKIFNIYIIWSIVYLPLQFMDGLLKEIKQQNILLYLRRKCDFNCYTIQLH